MSFIIKQETENIDGPWQVGTFCVVDIPYGEDGKYTKTIHTFLFESTHQNRMSAAAWCSYLNGGTHPDILNAKLVEARRAAELMVPQDLRGLIRS